MLTTPKNKGGLFLASSLCDGLEDNNIKQVTTLLLNNDADPNVLIPSHGITPFHLVIGNNSETFAEEVTKLFLRHGGNPNVRSADGLTPVHVAAAWGRVGVLELLLANGGDPLSLDDDGRSPFHYAFDGKYYKAIAVLGKYCGDVMEENEIPKYKIALDKVLVNNGNVMAEYVASDESFDIKCDVNKSASQLNGSTSPIIIQTNAADDCYESFRTDDKISSNINQFPCLSSDMITLRQHQISVPKTHKDVKKLYSEFENLSINKVTEREKVLVSEIINQLSTSVTSDSTINETLYSHKINDKAGVPRSSPRNEKCESCTAKVSKRYSLLPKQRYKKNIQHEYNVNALSPSRQGLTRNCFDLGIKSVSERKNKKYYRRIRQYSPDTSVLSKSPNCNIPLRTSKETNTSPLSHRLPSPISFEQKCNQIVYTPRAHKHHRKNLIIQSTPRRRHRHLKNFDHNDKYTNDISKKLFEVFDEKKETVKGTVNRHICDKSFNVNNKFLSPSSQHEETLRMKNRRYLNLAVKLHEGKYDEEDDCKYNDDETAPINIIIKQEQVSSISKKPEICNNNINNNISCKKELSTNGSMQMPDQEGESDNIYTKTSDHDINHEEIPNPHALSMQNEESQDSGRLTSSRNSVDISEENTDMINKQTSENDSWFSTANIINKCTKDFSYSEVSCDRIQELPKINKDRNTICQTKEKSFDSCEVTNDLISSRRSSTSCISIQKEYKYEDIEKGIILLERRLCVTSSISDGHSFSDIYSNESDSACTAAPLPKELLLIDNYTLRKRLADLGEIPGPITHTTRHVYLKRLVDLERFSKQKGLNTKLQTLRNEKSDTVNLKSSLLYGDWINDLNEYKILEMKTFEEFVTPDPTRRWREGTAKTSFNYLLLDSRITQNLPHRTDLAEPQIWSIFLSAIFYVGKGKRSRPYAHLYDAFNCWVSQKQMDLSKKIKCILDVWNDGYGVVCLHVFQNTIPVEAYTREAAMIDALGTEQLANCKNGEYYGVAATWNQKEKCKFGRYLLYRAMQILMHEGERQLFPEHL